MKIVLCVYCYALAKQGNMFPETFAAGVCSPSVSQKQNILIASRSKICFCYMTETYFALERLLPVWQNWETCPCYICFWIHCFLVLPGCKL